MAFSIGFCSEDDMHKAFILVSETFSHDQPYHVAMCPEYWTVDGHKEGASRFLASKNPEPSIRFQKATHKEFGELSGLIRYYINEENPTVHEKLGGTHWKDEDVDEYANHLYTQYLIGRQGVIKSVDGPVVCGLDLLTVHPKFQSQGAGTALVKWGTDLADSMGAEMTVESSKLGLEVYQKNGFRIDEERTLAVPEKWEERPKTTFWFMRRSKKA